MYTETVFTEVCFCEWIHEFIGNFIIRSGSHLFGVGFQLKKSSKTIRKHALTNGMKNKLQYKINRAFYS